ncbi:hypothetical protein PPACK8108_LOCUS24900 [Phakopsora pachyrhizi]|uniref:Uncharacterized protein n=1 Tax=Phakopsora pachyrhizi TaxID=170000 RepID=A0AAV0BU28_PHAPC|nr:hypothetical protein PPACK8108_LOCUS24900 [Phakopsora pachyrhizi]
MPYLLSQLPQVIIEELWSITLPPTHFHVDNSGLLERIKHFGSNSKTKYLDMKMKTNNIKVTLVPTEVMIADTLTKSSSNQSLLRLSSRCLKTFSPQGMGGC